MLKNAAVILISSYQKYIRGVLPQTCRFEPSCSEYAKQAIARYGFFQGAAKGAGRLLRCHPFSGRAGYDPVK